MSSNKYGGKEVQSPPVAASRTAKKSPASDQRKSGSYTSHITSSSYTQRHVGVSGQSEASGSQTRRGQTAASATSTSVGTTAPTHSRISGENREPNAQQQIDAMVVKGKQLNQDSMTSWKMSDVMADVGVTREHVHVRRALWLQRENVWTVLARLNERNLRIYHFGGHSEGTTTPGLNSDIDQNKCHMSVHLISDLSQWRPGQTNYLVVKTTMTSPGYRLLKPMRSDVAEVLTEIPRNHEEEFLQIDGVPYLLHERLYGQNPKGRRHGPVLQFENAAENISENFVQSFNFAQWPLEGQYWVERTEHAAWPTAEVRQAIVDSGCLLIPVGHRQSKNPRVEFRISPELGERLLMNELNITQIRCLTLLKILIKYFIEHPSGGRLGIKSYFCKTALWHVVAGTGNRGWEPGQLLPRLVDCLKFLRSAIDDNSLPHFLLPSMELFEGRYDDVTRVDLRELLTSLIEQPFDHLKKVTLDDIGKRLLRKLEDKEIRPTALPFGLDRKRIAQKDVKKPPIKNFAYYDVMSTIIRDFMFKFLHAINLAVYVAMSAHDVDFNIDVMKKAIDVFRRIESSNDQDLIDAVSFVKPMFCSVLGCLLGVKNTLRQRKKLLTAWEWLRLGAESDLTSGRLKLASGFYALSEYERAERLLKEIEDDYQPEYVMKVCACRSAGTKVKVNPGFIEGATHLIEEKELHKQCSYCVIFIRTEKPCVPIDFQREMYRSNEKEIRRQKPEDSWMNWACVDSLPFLHFLQYLTYTSLHDVTQRKYALRTLQRLADTEVMFHEETVYNLLGYCYERERDPQEALKWYRRSVATVSTNNAAIQCIRRLRTKYKWIK